MLGNEYGRNLPLFTIYKKKLLNNNNLVLQTYSVGSYKHLFEAKVVLLCADNSTTTTRPTTTTTVTIYSETYWSTLSTGHTVSDLMSYVMLYRYIKCCFPPNMTLYDGDIHRVSEKNVQTFFALF